MGIAAAFALARPQSRPDVERVGATVFPEGVDDAFYGGVEPIRTSNDLGRRLPGWRRSLRGALAHAIWLRRGADYVVAYVPVGARAVVYVRTKEPGDRLPFVRRSQGASLALHRSR